MARTEEDFRWTVHLNLRKVKAKRTSLRNFRRLMAQNKRTLASAARKYLNHMQKQLSTGLNEMSGRKASAIVERLTDWDLMKVEGARIFKPALLNVLVAGGEAIVERRVIKQEERFDPLGIIAVKWAEEHAAELVTQITDRTMKAIRAYVSKGLNAGKSVKTIAQELRPLVGLTEDQLFAVAHYHEWLITNKPELTAARQKEMADTYARRLHRRRADLIAVTETRDALWEGVFQGFEQMGIDKVEGVSGSDACDWCLDNINGQVMTIEEARALDTHPDCGCCWVTAG